MIYSIQHTIFHRFSYFLRIFLAYSTLISMFTSFRNIFGSLFFIFFYFAFMFLVLFFVALIFAYFFFLYSHLRRRVCITYERMEREKRRNFFIHLLSNFLFTFSLPLNCGTRMFRSMQIHFFFRLFHSIFSHSFFSFHSIHFHFRFISVHTSVTFLSLFTIVYEFCCHFVRYTHGLRRKVFFLFHTFQCVCVCRFSVSSWNH